MSPGHLRTALAVALTLLAVSGCAAAPGRSVAAPTATPGPSSPAYPLGLTTFAPAERAPVPAVTGRTWRGETVDLRTPRGRVTVVNAWAAWCEPCRQEARVLTALAARSPRTRFVGLDESGDAQASAAFVRSTGARYPQVRDDGDLLRRLAPWLPAALPGTLVLDRDGRVAARVVGPVRAGLLEPVLERLGRE